MGLISRIIFENREAVAVDDPFLPNKQIIPAKMVPLYAARIEDLGLGDFVKVDCGGCAQTALLTPAINTAVIEQEPYHQLCHQLTCLFRTALPTTGAADREACGIRQTEQVELMDWSVMGKFRSCPRGNLTPSKEPVSKDPVITTGLAGRPGLAKSGRFPPDYILWPFPIVDSPVIYRYGPSRTEPRWQWVSWGSALAAIAWLAASALFSWYAASFGSFNKTYGSLGAIIGFMLWMWLSIIVVLVGGKLNAEIEHQTARETTAPPPKSLGGRGAKMADTIGPARA